MVRSAFLMDFGFDERAASGALWTNITKQGCSMTLERNSITFVVQDFFNTVLIGRYRHLADFDVARRAARPIL